MRPHVVVVGGGLAGIAAALDCVAGGARVTVLEVRPRLGGAAYSFVRDGLSLDNGQHVFLRCCEEYLDLLDRLGARTNTTIQRRLDVPVIAPGGRVGRLRRSALPAPLHLAPSLARYRHLSPSDRWRSARIALAMRRLDPSDRALDDRSFGDWLAQRGSSPAAVEGLWDLIARPTLNLPAAEASLAQAIEVFRLGLLSVADAGDIGWALVPLGDLHDLPARRALAAVGADVRVRWRAERVAPATPGGWYVTGNGETIAADAVIVAVQHQRVEALLPPHALGERRPAALGSSPIVNLHVVYDRPVMALPFAAAIESPVQWVFDRTRSSGLARGQLLSLSLSAADDDLARCAEELRARYVPAVAALFPAAASARVERFVVTREHIATFRATPGAARNRPSARTAMRGLVLAGAYTDTGWPATMEGAVRSGRAAAREALRAGVLSAAGSAAAGALRSA
jgi:hydroxysqualene dehydroxylase